MQGKQAEAAQGQRIRDLPQQRLGGPAGALLNHHQPRVAGHRMVGRPRPTVAGHCRSHRRTSGASSAAASANTRSSRARSSGNSRTPLGDNSSHSVFRPARPTAATWPLRPPASTRLQDNRRTNERTATPTSPNSPRPEPTPPTGCVHPGRMTSRAPARRRALAAPRRRRTGGAAAPGPGSPCRGTSSRCAGPRPAAAPRAGRRW